MFEEVAVRDLVGALADHDFAAAESTDSKARLGLEHVDAVVAGERLIRFGQALIAEHTVGLDRCQHRGLNPLSADAGGTNLDDGTIARSVITELALARQMSTSGAETQYTFALGLASMPNVASQLRDGRVPQRVAKAVVDECAGTSKQVTTSVDDQLGPDLHLLTAKRAAVAARRLVIAADPHAADAKGRRARAGLHVNVTAAPDAMGRLNLHTTAAQAWACFGALDSHARGLKADGDSRTIGQIMADIAVERITGQTCAGDVATEINVLMRPETLFGDENTPALLAGYGPIPPGIARELTANSKTWVRRLFTDPTGDTITGRDPRRRRFDGPLGDLIRASDQHCQRPGCDCRIRSIDHRTPHSQGGPTTRANADGYCDRDHHTKHLPGFSVTFVEIIDGIPRVIQWQTPTGRTYQSRRPNSLGHGPSGKATPRAGPGDTIGERHLRKLLGKHGHLRQ